MLNRQDRDGTPGAGSEHIRQMRSRACIFANARQMIADRGYSGVSMRDLAERSGITPPTIYNLIGNRAAVLREAIAEGQQMKVAFASMLSRKTGINPILAYADTILNGLSRSQDYSRHSIHAIVHEKADSELSRLITQRSRTAMLSWLAQLERDGRIGRRVCLKTVAVLISRTILTVVAPWSEGEITIELLKNNLAVGMGTVLMGLMDDSERAQIEIWMTQ
ncbi:helix-turn-helix domain-containing protein [Sphingobium sp. AN558]|uniref:TetR/AcrR family transcriptional regulator n=1 Tax=Sphingobium sp. AN558 TaxID=3133442 RepID=UPI0030C29212